MALKSVWNELRQYLRDPRSRRTWSIAARDGIIATAGILLGFTGAGASDATLVMAATTATIAGMLTAGGAEWAEAAAERDAQLQALDEEITALERQRSVEWAEVVRYYRKKGLSRHLAENVASELMVRSPLKVALESGHGILKFTSPAEVLLSGMASCLAYLLGAAIPLIITFIVPINIEAWVIFLAAVVSLTLISIVGARAGQMDISKNIARTLVIGVGTIVISFIVGEIAF